ncbi:MAG: DUF58 domain-containing protein [Planctomycetes bacterium]|nr:DUF58 domain-containing protein [Planctomycetota bacterium]
MTGDSTELEEILAEVRRIEAEAHDLVTGVLAGGYSSMFRGSGIEFHELREYVEGDDPRSVDWNVTARQGRPFVKDFVEERDRTMLFLFDMSPSMRGGFGAWSARGLGVRILACFALAANQSDDKIGLIGFSDDVVHFVPTRKGIRHTLRILRDCLHRTAPAKHTDIASALSYAIKALHRRATILLVSDFIESCPETELAACARHHDLVAVRVSTPETTSVPRGLFRLRDPETGRMRLVDGQDQSVRAAAAVRLAEWREHCDETFRRAAIDVIDAAVPMTPNLDAIALPVLGFYRSRARTRRRARSR